MDILEFINILNNYLNFYFLFSEELIIIFLFYNFIKLLIFSSIFELIWPTQFFNRRNNFSLILKFRSFTETLLKLRYKYITKRLFNKIFFNYFFKY
jgi:hypothetical protein